MRIHANLAVDDLGVVLREVLVRNNGTGNRTGNLARTRTAGAVEVCSPGHAVTTGRHGEHPVRLGGDGSVLSVLVRDGTHGQGLRQNVACVATPAAGAA